MKPLLFIHGREAYRRNSLLILFNFYKNVLYVATQFYFGFYSAFSGQTIYEKYIHQLYNITMTSLPIMWFAVFDFQYEKRAPDDQADHYNKVDAPRPQSPSLLNEESGRWSKSSVYFMSNPELYRIGMDGECFSVRLYVLWVLYALWHAFVIYYIVYFALDQSTTMMPNGQDIGLWLAGTAVYGACTFVVNALLLTKFFVHHVVGSFFFFLSVLSYFVFFAIFSGTANDEISLLFEPSLRMTLVWAAFVFCVGQVVVFEKMAQEIDHVICARKRPQRIYGFKASLSQYS